MRKVTFTVYGEAKPKGSMNAFYVPGKDGGKGRNVVTSPKTTKTWQRLVSDVAQNYRPDGGLLDGPLGASIVFYLPKPSSKSKKKKWPDTKPDADKLLRAVLDGLEGIIYTNDSRICWWDKFGKIYDGKNPRVEITIREMSEDEAENVI
jgi:Holliday junction resolvase RusA-like endonuclease